MVDDLITAKTNLERVLSILRDYENFDQEVEILDKRLNQEQPMCDLLNVYKKLKVLNEVKMKLLDRIGYKPSSLGN